METRTLHFNNLDILREKKYSKETKDLTPGVFLIFHSNEEEEKNEDEKTTLILFAAL